MGLIASCMNIPILNVTLKDRFYRTHFTLKSVFRQHSYAHTFISRNSEKANR